MTQTRRPADITTIQITALAHDKIKSQSARGFANIKLTTLAMVLAYEQLGAEQKTSLLHQARTLLIQDEPTQS